MNPWAATATVRRPTATSAGIEEAGVSARGTKLAKAPRIEMLCINLRVESEDIPLLVCSQSAKRPANTDETAVASHGRALRSPTASRLCVPRECTNVGIQDWRMKKDQLIMECTKHSMPR